MRVTESLLLASDGGIKPASTTGYSIITRGRHVEDIPRLASILCGTQSWGHYLAASRALDKLFGRKVPAPAEAVRRAGLLLDIAHGHIHRLYTGILPRILAGRSHLSIDNHDELGEAYRGAVEDLAEAKTLIGGRPVHPAFTLPGGVSPGVRARLPGIREALEKAAEKIEAFAEKAAETIRSSNIQAIAEYTGLGRETLYVAMVCGGEPCFMGDSIRVVGEGVDEVFPLEEYGERFKITCSGGFCRALYRDGRVAVTGPLARMNAWRGLGGRYRDLVEEARGVFGGENMANAAAGIYAMAAELHLIAEKLRGLSTNIGDGSLVELRGKPGGRGVGGVEASHGLIIHEVSADQRYVVDYARALTPSMINIYAAEKAVGAAGAQWAGIIIPLYGLCGLELMHTWRR